MGPESREETTEKERNWGKNATRRLKIIRPRPRGDRECTGDLPVLEDQPTGLLHLEPAPPGPTARQAAGALKTAEHCRHETPVETVGKIIYDKLAERQNFVFLRLSCVRGSEGRGRPGWNIACVPGLGPVAPFRTPGLVGVGGGRGLAGLPAGR